ncbi:hypothetical protein ACIRN4_12165 [Pimelobacter simplex]|uniref:hypothetical protein n=1 Tax=Nocardioides simplex TaxID=2045 RepID=UPI0037FE7CEB
MSENVSDAEPAATPATTGTPGVTGAWSYRTGSWLAVFGPQAAIVLPSSQKDQVVALWATVDGGAGFDEVLDGLLASGLSRIPGFVLISTDPDGPTRFLLRGTGVVATVTSGGTGSAGETVTVDGAASHTWVEQTVDDVTALTITLPEESGAEAGAGSGSAGSGADFAIDTGLVRVGRIDRPSVVGTSAPEALEEPEAPDVPAVPDVPDVPVVTPAVVDVPDDGPLTEVMEVVDEPLVGDPLTDPLPVAESPEAAEAAESPEVAEVAADPEPQPEPEAEPEAAPEPEPEPAPAPDGWVTPWDQPAAVDPEPTPSVPPLGADAGAGAGAGAGAATEVAPPGWIPPPPPGVPVPTPDAAPDAPPLPIGSWEPVTGAYPPPPAPPAPPAPSAPAAPGLPGVEHDGHTVVGGGEPPSPPIPGIPGQPQVPAVTQPVAQLLVSDGQTIVVDRAVLIGRAPEARRFTSTEQPTLVTVPSRLHEISSTHVEVRPGTGADLGTAVVTDMGSTNGTVLVQPGLGPEDLKPGIAVQLIPGAIINLGDGVTIQVTRP